MSVRLEWVSATGADPTLYRAGDTAEDGNPVTSPLGLAVGTLVIEGTEAELENLLRHGLALVRGET